MITENDLREAIAECQGQKNPNSSTCLKLASYLTILDHMGEPQGYSYSAGTATIEYESDTEFAKLINGKDWMEILPIVDELMTTLSVVNPRLYQSVLRRVE